MNLILKGNGACTAVDGEKLPMQSGDFIVTPSWSWHDHGHHGSGPFVRLDLPQVRNAGAIFFEEYPDLRYPERRPPEDGFYRYGVNMIPIEHATSGTKSPLLSYPYEGTREALENLKQHSPLDPCHGLKMEFIDPTTGGAAIPTISIFIQLPPAEFVSAGHRSTDRTVFCVVEGNGTVGSAKDPNAWTFATRRGISSPYRAGKPMSLPPTKIPRYSAPRIAPHRRNLDCSESSVGISPTHIKTNKQQCADDRIRRLLACGEAHDTRAPWGMSRNGTTTAAE